MIEGSGDELIKPESLKEYRVPPPSVVDAQDCPEGSNDTDIQPTKSNEIEFCNFY